MTRQAVDAGSQDPRRPAGTGTAETRGPRRALNRPVSLEFFCMDPAGSAGGFGQVTNSAQSLLCRSSSVSKRGDAVVNP
jgi:hypothetical protein